MPKISIILPVYNTEPYLKECLYSIVNQTFQDIEIIIVNDCSPDNSENIILQYQFLDPRIRYIKNNSNKGLYHTRETGVKNASGEYILHVDSDDTIDLQLCEQIYPITFSSPDCITYNLLIDYKTHLEGKDWPNHNLQSFTKEKEFFYKVCSGEIHAGALVQKITKRDLALQVYKEINLLDPLTMGEDQLFNIWYSYYCTTVIHLDFNGYYYNITNSNSATHSTYDLNKAISHLDQLSIVTHKLQELCSLKNLPLSTMDPITVALLRVYIELSYLMNIAHENILFPKIASTFSPQILITNLHNIQQKLHRTQQDLYKTQQDLYKTHNNKYYQFGQLSRIQKIKKIFSILLKKTYLYSPIKSLYDILQTKQT